MPCSVSDSVNAISSRGRILDEGLPMSSGGGLRSLDDWKERFPEKFSGDAVIFSRVRGGDHVFVASGCGEPQYLIRAMVNYVEAHPEALSAREVIHVHSFGIVPYADSKFSRHFRHNSFFLGNSTRGPVNQGM